MVAWERSVERHEKRYALTENLRVERFAVAVSKPVSVILSFLAYFVH
jgi:hypothetical protein